MHTASGDDTFYTGYLNKEGQKHGVGKIIYVSSNEYQGEFVRGLKSGKGRFHYASNDSIYEGDWLKDLKNGYGIQNWINGAKYDGYWKDNLKDGEATMIFEDGNTYVGPWRRDKMHGIHQVTKNGNTTTIEYRDHKFVRTL